MAHTLKRRIDTGEFNEQAAMARALGFTRARISQLFDLLLLAPQVQEEVLFLEDAPGKQAVVERDGAMTARDRRVVELHVALRGAARRNALTR